MNDQPGACRDHLGAFAAQSLAAGEEDRAGTSPAASAPAAGRMVDAVECRQQLEIGVYGAFNLQHLAEPAAVLACAAGVGAQLLAPEDERRDRLVNLHRGAAHAAGISGPGKTVLDRPRAGAAIGDRGDGEQRAAAAVALAPAFAAEGEVPEAGCALGRHALRHYLLQTAEHHVRQHLTDDVPRADRGGIRRVQYRAFRSGDLE